jgi:hypothetical protein
VSEPTPPPVDAPVPAPEPEPLSESKRRVVQRWTRRVFALVVAVIAAVFVSFFSLDLGRIPQLREQAERQGSNYLRRPLHIGAISARITPGVFILHDVMIEGRAPGDRPFFKVRRILVNVPWWTIFQRQLHVNVRLDDWAMVIESWANGHNIPRLMPERGEPRPRRFTTTVDFAYAHGGHFTYEDHVTPWSVVAPNLSFDLVRSTAFEEYVGTASFNGGVVQIQNYEPMATDFRTRFELDGALVRLRHIDLMADGSQSHVNGEIDMANWPNQAYNVSSTIDFARMRELFFTRETWRLGGEGQFSGRFILGKGGVRDLTGSFSSRSAVVNDVEFTGLHGDLTWLPSHFSVGHAEADVLGGHTRFRYSIAPLGARTTPTMSFDADYRNVDLFELDRLMNLRGLRLAGAATGSVSMQWPSGRMSSGRRGLGHTVVTPMSEGPMAPEALPAVPLPPVPEPRPFDPNPLGRPMAVAADLHYRFEPGVTTFEDSRFSTTHSFISFSGRMESGGAAEFPFHVTSHDWQESDRLLAAIMTAVGGPTRAVEVGGRGTFDGVMTGSFSSPRIEGQFAGENVRAWDVRWGKATADLVIQGGYIDISNSRIGDTTDQFIIADGRYALGFRNDGAEEIRARVRMANWPIVDLRHALLLDDWPMDGTMGDLDLTLSGQYRNMFGKGRMRIDNGRAWDEGFEVATADLELEGTGMRVSRIEMHKGPGRMFGAARIGWDGTYVFNADGEGVPVEMLDNFKVEGAPLSGRLRFKVSGAGEFETPAYTFEASIDDLFVGDEGIGAVSGRVAIVDDVMTIERLVAASSRLQVLGTGTIMFDEAYTSDLRIRFQETALDPYLKFVLTDDVSPYTRVVVGGSLAVTGPLTSPADLTVDTVVDNATVTLYDYDLRNDGPLRMRFADGRLAITTFDLEGSNTNLQLTGGADVRARTLNLSAAGDASLSILQLFFEGITSAGAARLNATLEGSFDAPRLTGDASISEGRFRPFGSPHSLEAINGRIRFASNAINLDDVTARIGSGDVVFGGNIALDGYQLADYNLTATGRSMRLRYPAGFNSTVDMRLFLTGPRDAPLLTGTIDVLRVALVGASQSSGGLLGFATAGTAGVPVAAAPAPVASSGIPLALDIQVTAPRMRVIDNNEARIEASADLQVRGTFDVPVIEGAVEVAGGEVLFNGNRYFVREGSVDFNPGEPDPVFNLTAETRPRVSGQVFTVNVGISGTFDRIDFTTSSDPWLPESDVISLLFGGTPALGTAEERSLRSSQELQQQMLQTAGAALLASPLTSRVGAAFERTGAFDTVQITPVLTNEDAFQQLNPTARVTFGKRVSPRVFLTYSRTLGGLEEEIILLEYDQNDRMSWVLSRNEDRTFALDFRIRYVF